MQKHANLVDFVKNFPTNIFLQNLASIQKRTSPKKFDHLAEKSESAVRYRIFQLRPPDRTIEQPSRERRRTAVKDMPERVLRKVHDCRVYELPENVSVLRIALGVDHLLMLANGQAYTGLIRRSTSIIYISC